MGALEFSPPLEGPTTRDADEAIAIARLVDEARRIIDGDLPVAIPEMMQVGASIRAIRSGKMVRPAGAALHPCEADRDHPR